MKILYCLTATCNSGGTEKIVIAKANELAKRGHKVVIATTEQNGKPDFFALSPAVERVDFDVNYMTPECGTFIRRKHQRQCKKALHRRLLSELLERCKFDIVISTFGNEMNFLPTMTDGSKKILEIHTTRDFRIHNRRGGLMGLYDRWLTVKDGITANRFDAFVCLTNRDARNWRGVKNLHVIPNPACAVSAVPSPLVAKRITAAGRLSREKGYERMIAAWTLVHQTHPDWRLDIFGSGPLHKELSRLIQLTGNAETITIHAPVADIMAEYRAGSALALTSRYEGLPMVLLEGLSCGLPLVAFDIDCGPSDLIDDGKNGFLIPDGDIEGFAAAICSLIESEEMRQKMGAASLVKAAQFRRDKIIDKWEELFQRVQLES